VPKLEEENICKPWLTVRPKYGMLLPNESMEMTFTAQVTPSLWYSVVDLCFKGTDTPFCPSRLHHRVQVGTKVAQALNAGSESLEDILILRLENGRDFYLSVQGDYARSCFGMSLEELTTCYDPGEYHVMSSIVP